MARQDGHLTQRELAARAGVSQSEVARIESGKREPSIPTLQKILAGAGVELRFHLAPLDDHDRVLERRQAKRGHLRKYPKFNPSAAAKPTARRSPGPVERPLVPPEPQPLARR
jgi:transcriptional regulator with XRE-family HTH domain